MSHAISQAVTAGPTSAEVLPRVQQMLQQILSLESTEQIQPDARLRDDLNIDSIGMVDVLLGIEDEFGVRLGSDINLLERVVTVGDAVDLILEESARGVKSPGALQ
jgi:acyl carrier protein